MLPFQLQSLSPQHSGAGVDHVDLAAAQRVRGVFRRKEAEDDPIQIGRMLSPVARIPDERHLLAALPGPDKKRAAPDRTSCLRVVDPVLPETLEVLAGKCVSRQDDGEEKPPVHEARAENNLDRLWVEPANAADTHALISVRLVLPKRLKCENEVLRADRDSVAPASLRTDVVDEGEGLLRNDRRIGEVRLERRVGQDLEGTREDLFQPEFPTRVDEHVETRRLAGRSRPDDERAAAFWRLRTHPARSRDGEERDGDRRS